MCKQCHKEYYRSKTTSEKRKDSRLRSRYGISLIDYTEMLEEQNHSCYICGYRCDLHVDHCHETGEVRKLLCAQCNNGLGCFRDNTLSLSKAIEYLKEHTKE